MRIFPVLLLALSLAVGVSPLKADEDRDGIAELKRSIEELDSLRASFEQTVLDSDFTVDEVSRGTVTIKKPGRFRWDYTEPHEQLIVSDGERVWIYEEDLMQVTVREMDETLASSPAMLLTGRGDLEESFVLEDMGPAGELHWVQLTPRVQDSEFETIRVGLDADGVSVMELRDQLGQTTRIEFRTIERNPELDEEQFHFEPPDGVDVVEQ